VSFIPYGAVLIAIWGGLCSADQRSLGGRQIHQPIVAAVGAGLLLGAPIPALLVGLWLQLVWPVTMPVGGRLLPDTGAAGAAGGATAALIAGPLGVIAGILLGLLLGFASIPWERRLRERNAAMEEAALERRGGKGLGRAVARGIAGPFSRGALCALFAGTAGSLLSPRLADPVTLAALGPWIGTAPGSLIGGAACVGLATLLHRARAESGTGSVRWVAGGFLGGLLAWLLLHRGAGG